MYTAINEVLQRLHAPLDAAEMHGLLCGFVCLQEDSKNPAWLEYIMDENPPDTQETKQCYKVLLSLQQHIVSQLCAETFDFTPLLPSDENPLEQRVEAISHWCQGFVYGIGIGGLKDASRLSPTAQEFIEDATELTRLDENAPADTDHEMAYMHVVEYLKVGVLTLYDEIHQVTTPPTRTVH